MNYEEFLKETIKNCNSKADFCRALNKKPTGGNYATIDKIIRDYNLDISHFKSSWNKGIKYFNPIRPLSEILVKNSPYKNTHHLKQRLLNAGLLENKCSICGKTKRLELHHIDGDPSNNELNNLQILCIECHYDTKNFRNKNGKGRIHLLSENYILTEEEQIIKNEARVLAKRKGIGIKEAFELIKNSPNQSIKDFPKKERKYLEDAECPVCHKIFHKKFQTQKYCSQECVHKSQSHDITKENLLENIIRLNGNFTQLGKVYGITDNAIRKWCKKFGFPTHSNEIKKYINSLGQ